MGLLIHSRMVDTETRLNDKLRNCRVIFESYVVTMSFVPLRSVLKTILQDCDLLNIILVFMNHLESSSGHVLVVLFSHNCGKIN